MKIYSTLIRITIFVAALGLLILGIMFTFQNWNGGGILLSGGVLLSAVMVVDFVRARRNA